MSFVLDSNSKTYLICWCNVNK